MNNNVTNHIIFYQSWLPSRIFKLLDIYHHCPAVTYIYKGKGKAIPLQARCGPDGLDGWKIFPTGIRSRTVQPVAQSLYRLSYRAHLLMYVVWEKIQHLKM